MIKVLIVEDDPLILRMYEQIFLFEKYEVVLAVDGQEGLDKARTTKPTIILLDVMMPKMNGIETLRRIKSDPEIKNIPVIMLTNLDGQKDAETALANGAVKYIVKSQYTPNQIADMVKGILAGYTRDQIPGS